MVTIEAFQSILDEIYATIPPEILKGLNLGIIIDENIRYHDAAIGNDLICLGLYTVSPLGRGITIFYGSFMHVYGHLDPKHLKEKAEEVLKHELTHHLEHLAGERDLEIEDAQYIHRYLESHGRA